MIDTGLTPEEVTAIRLQQEALTRMRWRLWFAFADSKYDSFKYKGRKGKPNYAVIKKYCIEHWGKEPADMTLEELRKSIAIVNKWKNEKDASDKR